MHYFISWCDQNNGTIHRVTIHSIKTSLTLRMVKRIHMLLLKKLAEKNAEIEVTYSLTEILCFSWTKTIPLGLS